VESWGQRSTLALWIGLTFTWLLASPSAVTAQARTLVAPSTWREPLSRAEHALASGEPRQAELAWEEARRAAIRSRLPHALLEVGVAYLSIGEVTRDRQTAAARARQLFLESLFRARERRDVDGIAAAGQAFAALGDCEVADRAFRAIAAQRPERPVCARADSWRQPAASPRQDIVAPVPLAR
jgi:hypothetical protein